MLRGWEWSSFFASSAKCELTTTQTAVRPLVYVAVWAMQDGGGRVCTVPLLCTHLGLAVARGSCAV